MARIDKSQLSSRKGRESLLSKLEFIEGKRCLTWFDTLQDAEAVELRRAGPHLMGQSTLFPPYVACRPYSKFELLLFPVEGEIRLILPKRITTVHAGEAWLIPANSLARMDLPCGRFQMTWVHFDPGTVPASIHSGEGIRLSQDPRIGFRMNAHLQSLRWERSTPSINSRQRCHHLYALIQLELEQLLHPGNANRRQETLLRIRQTWEAVETDFTQRWDVQTMAAHANLSTSRLYCLCLEHFGMTPQERLAQVRMNRALGLLLSSDQKIESIASDAGYSTLFAFSKAFKKRFGMSPKGFRESRTDAISARSRSLKGK